MKINNKFLKLKNTKFLFLLVSLFLTPLNASIKDFHKTLINSSNKQSSKDNINNKINIFEEKLISQNDLGVIDDQDPKSESNNFQKDLILINIEEEINQTIYKTNSEKSKNKIQNQTKSNIDFDNTPPSGKISVGEFLIPTRGYIDLEGPEISINLVDTDVLETLKFLAKSANYGFLYIGSESNESNSDEISIPKINASFNNQKFSRVFNSLFDGFKSSGEV